MDRHVVGRDVELDRIGALFDGVGDGPAVLDLVGAAGIGKTTLWAAGIELARQAGLATLTCAPASSEVRLSYSGLTDLLAVVDPDVVGILPAAQSRALNAALLRDSAVITPDPRAVAAGFLSLVDALAASGPLLIAVDDYQWIDEPTRSVVAYAIRRCVGPVAVLATHRLDDDHGDVAGLTARNPRRCSVVRLGPLSVGALHHVIREQLGRSLPRPVLVRIAGTSGGNPFYALELARSLNVTSPTITELPDSLRAVVADRLEALSAPVREVLLLASALANPRIDLIQRAAPDGDVVALLEHAEDAGVIQITGGTIRFTHPLLAGEIYTSAKPSRRRALHRQLSRLVHDVEERARHLALAAVTADADTIAALDAAAEQARARGAPAVAAELLELAMSIGGDDPTRATTAARDHFNAGNPAAAQRLLEMAIPRLAPGPLRAEAHGQLGMLRFQLDASPDAVDLLETAIGEAGPDLGLRCGLALNAAWVTFNCGRGPAAVAHATRAARDAEACSDDGLLAVALACKMFVDYVVGHGVDEEALTRALALEDATRPTPVANQPLLIAALVRWYAGDLDQALTAFAAVRQRCLDNGAEGELWFLSHNTISAACAAGETATAQTLLDDLVERASMVDTGQAHAWASLARARFFAWTGDVEQARQAGLASMARFEPNPTTIWPLLVAEALGMAELSDDNIHAAVEWLAPAAAATTSVGFGEAATVPFVADAAEALIAAGRSDDAEPIVAIIEHSGQRPESRWARAVGARCRGLLLAARSETEQATVAFETALEAHDTIPQLRYDRARTLLSWGRHQRRCSQRRAARASLNRAADLFDEVGALHWARNARQEIDRLGLQPASTNDLTPSEWRVAELSAVGMTNREVAAVLLVSPKTVEAHLSRIYRKLDIRSRAELGRIMVLRE